MDDILRDLGWGDGLRVPVANDENKALELEVQKKQKEKENLKSVLESVTDRVTAMKKHLENVRHQIEQNQNLIFAHNNQKNTEENLVKSSRVEENALLNDIKKIKKEQKDVKGRQNVVQADINRVFQHVEKLKASINLDKDALVAWDEEVSRGGDDTHMLEKFKKEDEAKFKELEFRSQNLSLEVENKKNRLIGLKNDVISMEQELDKTAQMFRRQHVERRILVQQWEGSVRVLYQRDEDINRLVEEIGNLKTLAKQRLKDLEEQKLFFENEQKNNKEVERDIEILNKQVSDTKDKIQMMDKIITDENEKLITLRTILANTSTHYHKQVAKHKNVLKEIDLKNYQITELREKLEKTKGDFKNCRRQTMTAAQRVLELQEMAKAEEKIAEKNVIQFKKLEELLFQVLQQIKELKEGEKHQKATMGHIEACSVDIKKKIAKANFELNRQKEILYNMDFAYMEKDILLNQMMGLAKGEEQEKYEKRVAELEELHVKLTATNSLFTREVMRLEEDMRRLTIELQGDAKEQNYMRSKRQENILLVESGEKQLKSLRLQNQDKQVDENVLKLRVKQAEKTIDRVGGRVFSLEKQRLELEEAMKEREIEIKSLRDIMNVRRRVLNEQSTNLNSRISLARIKIENLKNKYDVSVLKLGRDENGEPLSATHFKIKGAQEKFELQELGDKLDSKIKKTEKEIEAMENTVKVVNATNKAYKSNLERIDKNSPEEAEKEDLKKTHAKLLEENRKRKEFLDSLNKITTKLEQEYQEKLNVEDFIMKTWKEKEDQAADLDKDLRDQEEKLERAEKQLKRLIKEVRGSQLQKFQTMEEKDIELRELKEQNEYGLQQLAELVAKTYDTAPVVIRYLSEKGLSLPMIKSPSNSIKYASTTSLVSPGRSSVGSRSSGPITDRTSSSLITPSVITLDSARLSVGSKAVKIEWQDKPDVKKASAVSVKDKEKKLESLFARKTDKK